MKRKAFVTELFKSMGLEVVEYHSGFGGIEVLFQGHRAFIYADRSTRTGKVSFKVKGCYFGKLTETELRQVRNFLAVRGIEANVEIFEGQRGGVTGYLCHSGNDRAKYMRIVFQEGYPWN